MTLERDTACETLDQLFMTYTNMHDAIYANPLSMTAPASGI